MKYAYYPSLLILLLAAACHPDPVNPNLLPIVPVHIDPTDTLPNLGQIHFDSMQIGQRSRYVYFRIADNYPVYADSIIDYKADTLVVAITGHDAEGFIIKEFMTQGSVADTHIDMDSVYTYRLRNTADSLYIVRPDDHCWCNMGRIFLTPDNALPLAAVASPQTSFVGWEPVLTTSSAQYYYQPTYVENFQLFGQTFDRLNVLVDNRLPAADGPVLIFTYSSAYGLVRWAYHGTYASTYGYGWDLLPE